MYEEELTKKEELDFINRRVDVSVPKVDAITPSDKRLIEFFEYKTPTIEVKSLLSTRQMLIALGRPKYDGPEFKFVSRENRRPNDESIYTLATHYLMKVIIPNALLAKQYGAVLDINTVYKALKHCMNTGKSVQCILYWQDFLAQESPQKNRIKELIWFYLFDLKSDGTPVEPNRRCFFKKFVDKKCKDQKPFRKGKLSDELQKLLKRAENEPELKTASKRELMAMGVSQRLALMFIQARKP